MDQTNNKYIVKYFNKCLAMHLAVADIFLIFVWTRIKKSWSFQSQLQ